MFASESTLICQRDKAKLYLHGHIVAVLLAARPVDSVGPIRAYLD